MLVECVPNFSEGRKGETVERIARAIESVPGATVLNRHLDADHNRSVITFVAEPQYVIDAALRAVATAAELIDLRKHAGEHPRIGATDVLPFIPVSENGFSRDATFHLSSTSASVAPMHTSNCSEIPTCRARNSVSARWKARFSRRPTPNSFTVRLRSRRCGSPKRSVMRVEISWNGRAAD